MNDGFIIGRRDGPPSERSGVIVWKGEKYKVVKVAADKGCNVASIRSLIAGGKVTMDEIMTMDWKSVVKLSKSRYAAEKSGNAKVESVKPVDPKIVSDWFTRPPPKRDYCE